MTTETHTRVYDDWKAGIDTCSDHYASHQPVLIEMLKWLKSPRVLELGIGHGSTHAIQEFSMHSVSMETDPHWLARFAHYERTRHRFYLVTDYTREAWNVPELGHDWDIAFVDNAPGESRQSNIVKLANNARFIIVHDTEEGGYKYDFSGFKYKFTFDFYRPWTTVLSNFEPIPELWT